MKKALVTIIALLLAMVITASAQQTDKISVFLGSGFSIPVGPKDFSDNWKSGINFGGGIEIRISEKFSIVPRIHYNSMAMKEGALIEYLEEDLNVQIPFGATSDGGDTKLIGFGADMKMSLLTSGNGKITPYLLGGLGMTIHQLDDIELSFLGMTETFEIDGSETLFTLEFGAGLDMAISPKVSLFIDGKYVLILRDEGNPSYIPIHAGLKIGF